MAGVSTTEATQKAVSKRATEAGEQLAKEGFLVRKEIARDSVRENVGKPDVSELKFESLSRVPEDSKDSGSPENGREFCKLLNCTADDRAPYLALAEDVLKLLQARVDPSPLKGRGYTTLDECIVDPTSLTLIRSEPGTTH